MSTLFAAAIDLSKDVGFTTSDRTHLPDGGKRGRVGGAEAAA
jgi:hypothetical protein